MCQLNEVIVSATICLGQIYVIVITADLMRALAGNFLQAFESSLKYQFKAIILVSFVYFLLNN